ncbi:MAG: HAD family hydrolase [Anaerolineales bacterium]|jgi:phosphoglycolate phosphatase-like HAD superfamily hydrolase
MTLDISRIQVLCFDVDGTLNETDNQWVSRITRWLHPIRFIFPNGDPLPVARRMVMSIEGPGNFIFNVPDRLGIDDEMVAIGDYLHRLGWKFNHGPSLLIPGTRKAIRQLQPHYPMAIVTNRGERTTRSFLAEVQLQNVFHPIATAQTCEYAKPYPDPIHWVADQLGVAPEVCLMIGDTTVDIEAGNAAGSQTVGVLCGFGENEELWDSGADLILSSTADLPAILLNDSNFSAPINHQI